MTIVFFFSPSFLLKRKHPWFQVNLPAYLSASPEISTRRVDKIDYEIVQEIMEVGKKKKRGR
jgi:hypothetical protein